MITNQQKGRAFELEIAKSLRDSGLDERAKRMKRSGAIYGLESDIFQRLPITIECKQQETTKFQEWYRQASTGVNTSKIPVVVWKEDHGQPFAFLKWTDFLEIMVFATKGGWTQRLMFPKPVKIKKRRSYVS